MKNRLKLTFWIFMIIFFIFSVIHVNNGINRTSLCKSWGVDDKSLLKECEKNEFSSKKIVAKQQKILMNKYIRFINDEIQKNNNLGEFDVSSYNKIRFDDIGINYYTEEKCLTKECVERNITKNNLIGAKYIVTAFLTVNESNGYFLTSHSMYMPVTTLDNLKEIPIDISKLDISIRKYINNYCDRIIDCKVSVAAKAEEILVDGYSVLGLNVDGITFLKKENLSDLELNSLKNYFQYLKNLN